VQAAVETPATKDAGSPSLNQLLARIRTNLGDSSSSSDPKLRGPVKRNVSAVAESITKQSAILREAVAKKNLVIVDAIYDLGSGKVEFWK
jgi:carbonic anhydrase